ncbi:MAG: hypothetical protein L0Y71_14640 [Gemmataceae bacterium]|nr:hypothetical protein [Gemmataceae bacterium]
MVGNGKSRITLSGTVAAVNNALDRLRFKPAPGFRGKARLSILTMDLGHTGFGGLKTALNLVNINVR